MPAIVVRARTWRITEGYHANDPVLPPSGRRFAFLDHTGMDRTPLADAELDGRDVAHILLLIVQKAAQACEQRTSGDGGTIKHFEIVLLRYPTSKICRSIRFVCVGPVMMRSPVAFRKLKESLRCRYFDGSSPRSTAREHVAGSTRPPAAAVGPSVPSVATLAKHDGRFGGRDAI